MARILYLNGPNLNLLGRREPDVYGVETLSDIEAQIRKKASASRTEIGFVQSNHEGEMIEYVQSAQESYDGIVLNAGGYTHTSVALRDAISSAKLPVIELHLSNIYAREDFRHKSLLSAVAIGVICGFGGDGYCLALDAMSLYLKRR